MMHPDFFDRDGNPIEMVDWALLHINPIYCRVAQTQIGMDCWVSTVWLGMDHGFGFINPDLPILIFETMVKENDDWINEMTERYSTEEQAIAGHDQVVAAAKERHPGAEVISFPTGKSRSRGVSMPSRSDADTSPPFDPDSAA